MSTIAAVQAATGTRVHSSKIPFHLGPAWCCHNVAVKCLELPFLRALRKVCRWNTCAARDALASCSHFTIALDKDIWWVIVLVGPYVLVGRWSTDGAPNFHDECNVSQPKLVFTYTNLRVNMEQASQMQHTI
jgi:hypothetical protein